MKTIKLLISVILLTAVVVAFDSCKGKGSDPEPETEAKRVTDLLTSGMWKLGSVTVDGVAKSLYPGLTINFTTASFSSANGSPVWPGSGTWQFTDDTAKTLKRNDDTVVAIESVDDKNLTLSLTWTQTTLGPGRSSSVAGKHVFIMGK